jgi:amidohydrolase
MSSLSREILSLREELVELRRDFHRHPELGFQELETSDKIRRYLEALGLEVKSLARTGVVGLLRGSRGGKTLMLRADMDALPIQEENDLPYRSERPGVMHACGHDGHMAMLLVAAKVLAAHREELSGTVKFVFQPNEEIAGAGAMIEAGVLQDPAVDAALALHLWSALETGTLGVSAGAVTATLSVFDLEILGKGGHTAFPQEAIDPVVAAAAVVQAVQTIQTREISPQKPTVIMFGSIHGGAKANIVPESVRLSGSLRYLYEGGPKAGEAPEDRFERVVKGVCEAHRTRYRLEFNLENRAVLNDPELAKRVRRCGQEVLGAAGRVVDYRCLAAEDFSEYCLRVPGVLSFLGTGNGSKGSDLPHHNPRFNIDEDSLPLGVELHARCALDFLAL